MNKTAFVFPAFISEFTGKELDFLQNNHIQLADYLIKASEVIHLSLPEFSYENDDYKTNELFSQILAYTFSCLFNDILRGKGIVPDMVAGYSMGIYASLYAIKAISFEDGISLINEAYKIVSEISQTKNYGMGAIIGLSFDDVKKMINQAGSESEIINVNNEHSLVLAGTQKGIEQILDNAKEEGAISTAKLIVDTPYHSKYLLKYSMEFKKFIDSVLVKDAEISFISAYNQVEIKKATDLKNELQLNLTQKINWHKTMQKLLEKGVCIMYECGAGKDLKKISRFIEGNYKLWTVYKA